MFRYLVKRLLILIPVIICISIVLFGIAKAMPGDPVRAMLPTSMRPEQRLVAEAAMREKLGLDKSLPEQYVRWMYNMIIEGDLGWSTVASRPVTDAVATPLFNTIILNLFVNFFYLAIAIPVGIRMAVKRGSIFDNGIQVASIATYSIPSFFLALTLIFVFAINLPWFPAGGMPNSFMLDPVDNLIAWARHLVLPVVTLTLISLAGSIRYVRNAMIDALSQDYIRTARSKGLGEKVVIYSHALRNAMIPISTIIVFTLFGLFAGSAITESVFAYNGIGRLLFRALTARDTALIISMDAIFALMSVVAVLVADILYGLVDPRIKLE